jgi:hypothetical protein
MALSYDDDPKVAALAQFGEDAGLCRDLHLSMIRYANRARTDGLVPAVELRKLAYPLSPERADVIAGYLADVELILDPDGKPLAGPMAVATVQIANYAKWNRPRAWLDQLSAERAESGRKGAAVRWTRERARQVSTTGQPGLANGWQEPSGSHDSPDGKTMATELKQELNPTAARTPAGARAREAEASSDDEGGDLRTTVENAVLAFMAGAGHPLSRPQAAALIEMTLAGRKPRDPGPYVLATIRKDPAAAARRVTTSRQPPPARDVLPDARRPGGPAADVAVRAAEARALLAARTNPAPPEAADAPLPDW